MRRYAKTNSVTEKITAETIGQLEQMIRFDGGRERGTRQIVLSTKIFTNRPKRVIGKDYNWQDVSGGMNVVIPKTIRRARVISKRIAELDPIAVLRGDITRSAISMGSRLSVPKTKAWYPGEWDNRAVEY